MKFILYSICLFCSCDYALNQYITANRNTSKSSCLNPNNAAQIEHFFNIIFTEFHNTPPVCVCVQMCTDQATYCYPNGCFKKEGKENTRMNNMQFIPHGKDADKKWMIIVDEKNDFMTDLLKKIDVGEPKTGKIEENIITQMRPDPFKDKYKMLFKYKKLPKVQLRYNLREQVKNMKSDILKIETMDVSNTRWPMNKDKRMHKKQYFSEIKTRRSPTNKNSNTLYVSVYPANNVSHSSTKYIKRDLSNKTDDRADIYVDAAIKNTGFSLENLIDNLIENSLIKNDTIRYSEISNDNDNNEQKENVFTESDVRNEISSTTLATVIDKKKISSESSIVSCENETNANIITLNVTNDIMDVIKEAEINKNTMNILAADKNGDIDVRRNTNTNTFKKINKMITSLEQRIEIQNNTSMEIMKRIIGETQVHNVATQYFEIDEITPNDIIETTATAITENIKSATQQQYAHFNKLRTIKRNRQKLRRKLENSKRN